MNNLIANAYVRDLVRRANDRVAEHVDGKVLEMERLVVANAIGPDGVDHAAQFATAEGNLFKLYRQAAEEIERQYGFRPTVANVRVRIGGNQ